MAPESNPTPALSRGGGESPADAALAVARLRELRLAAYAYAALPAGAASRAALRGDYLAALARHHRIRADVLPLLGAWRAAGVEAMVFKGFALAELVYAAPGMRFHGDVDVVVRPHDERRAVEIARRLGWTASFDSFAEGRTWGHGVADLAHPGGATQVDLQRFVVHSFGRWPRRQRRLTTAVWRAARTASIGDVELRVPSDVDAVVILALQRAWGDMWGVKAHDRLDLQALAARIGDGWRGDVRVRARALGCARTVDRFLDRCLETGSTALGVPPRAARIAHEMAVAREHPWRWIVRRRRQLATVAAASIAVPRGLVRVVRARRALARHGDVTALLAALTPPPAATRPLDARRRARTVLGIRWAMRLARGDRYGRCLVQSLAVYTALRRDGWPVQLVTGVRRTSDGIVGHAWVRCVGRVLPELGEPDVEALFAVGVCWPASGGSEREGRPD